MQQRTHTDQSYDQQLRSLRDQLLLMGGKVEGALGRAMHALVERDAAAAEMVITADREIDQLEKKIDSHCINILATRQPMGSDLRTIATAFKINTDLERIGDLAANIAERAIELAPNPPPKPYIDIPHMAEQAQRMIRKALDAYVKSDLSAAEEVIQADDEIDDLNVQIFRELMSYIMEKPQITSQAISMISVCRYLERIADHATNVAEMVIYMIKGEDIRHPGGPPPLEIA